jgi:hypothetical protein
MVTLPDRHKLSGAWFASSTRTLASCFCGAGNTRARKAHSVAFRLAGKVQDIAFQVTLIGRLGIAAPLEGLRCRRHGLSRVAGPSKPPCRLERAPRLQPWGRKSLISCGLRVRTAFLWLTARFFMHRVRARVGFQFGHIRHQGLALARDGGQLMLKSAESDPKTVIFRLGDSRHPGILLQCQDGGDASSEASEQSPQHPNDWALL